jgi:polyribonucleotide nucleotidyltransferase
VLKLFSSPDKQARGQAVDVLKGSRSCMMERDGDDYDANQLMLAFEVLQEEVYRSNILDSGKRADGRTPPTCVTFPAK